MLIVLEGCDGSGKTTLAGELAEYANQQGVSADVLKFSQPTMDDPFLEYELPLHDPRITADDHLIICDRLHWGEAIYGPLFRDKSRLDAAGLRHIDMLLQAKCATMVHVHTPEHEVMRRLTARGDDFVEPRHVHHIVREYEELAVGMGRHVIWVNGDDGPGLPEKLFLTAKQGAYAASLVRMCPTYIGPVYPNMLLLGEKRGDDPGSNELPSAFVPYKPTSGHYLLTSLNDALAWPSVGIVNALEDDRWIDLWDANDRPPVVALGVNAHHEADRQRIPNGFVPHPQYMRRFHFTKRAAYAEMICTAARERRRVWPT